MAQRQLPFLGGFRGNAIWKRFFLAQAGPTVQITPGWTNNQNATITASGLTPNADYTIVVIAELPGQPFSSWSIAALTDANGAFSVVSEAVPTMILGDWLCHVFLFEGKEIRQPMGKLMWSGHYLIGRYPVP